MSHEVEMSEGTEKSYEYNVISYCDHLASVDVSSAFVMLSKSLATEDNKRILTEFGFLCYTNNL